MSSEQQKIAFTIMRRDHETGLSKNFDVISASTRAEAKSLFHMLRGVYDTDKHSYWVSFPVMR